VHGPFLNRADKGAIPVPHRSSPAKAGDPVFQSSSSRTDRPRRTGFPAFAGNDG
jgi:hypothetical protein